MKSLEAQQRTFEALTDTTRLRMVHLLMAARTAVCQCELVDSLEVSPANVSRHAKILLHSGLLTARRQGKWVYYDLEKDAVPLLQKLTAGDDPILKADQRRFEKRLKIRESGQCLLGVQNVKFVKGGEKS